MTQSPESDIGTGLDLKYFIILEQPKLNRKFALSQDLENLYIMNPEETHFRVYVDLHYRREIKPYCEQSGRYSNGARDFLTSIDNSENPKYCQVKIFNKIKTYKSENRVIRTEV